MTIALDATYSVGASLSGVGIYSREILAGLADAHPEQRFAFCYRPHRFLRAPAPPPNCRRSLLIGGLIPRPAALFHGLNQRLPAQRFRRSITTFHDLFVLTGDYSTAEFRRRFAAQARDAALRSDAIIAVSRFTADQVSSLLKVPSSRIHVVHHGLRALPVVEVAREDIVLNVGAIQRRKNIAGLVRAFESLPGNWRLVLAGSAGFGAAGILELIQASRCRDRIILTGYIDSRTLAAWYAKARIFAFPSLDEGFGLPVLEAMAAGVPVLASDRSALPEVCGDAALLVNADDLTPALSRLAADLELQAELRQRGLRRAAQFTWKKAVEETWEVYRGLM